VVKKSIFFTIFYVSGIQLLIFYKKRQRKMPINKLKNDCDVKFYFVGFYLNLDCDLPFLYLREATELLPF